MEALVDQPMGRVEQQLLDEHGLPVPGHPATHGPDPFGRRSDAASPLPGETRIARMPGRIYEATGGRLFAALYDRMTKGSEDAGLADMRARVLAKAQGATLELGAG